MLNQLYACYEVWHKYREQMCSHCGLGVI